MPDYILIFFVQGHEVISILPKFIKDPTYSLQAIKFAQQAEETDDVSNRPVVYVEVREMAPIQSRLRKVEVLKSPPEYAMT